MSSRGRSRSRSRSGDRRGGGGERISVLVRNLPLDATGDEVRHLFSKYGPVRDVYLPKDYYTGRPKGFGFIEFTDIRDAEDAIYRLDRTMFGGRELNVCKSREGRKKPDEMRIREDPQRGRGGGGGYGGGYGGGEASPEASPAGRSPRSRSASPERSPPPEDDVHAAKAEGEEEAGVRMEAEAEMEAEADLPEGGVDEQVQ